MHNNTFNLLLFDFYNRKKHTHKSIDIQKKKIAKQLNARMKKRIIKLSDVFTFAGKSQMAQN